MYAPIYAYDVGCVMVKVDTDRARILARLSREGWEIARHGSNHDVLRKAGMPVIVLPRHRTLSSGVARSIAKSAGWI